MYFATVPEGRSRLQGGGRAAHPLKSPGRIGSCLCRLPGAPPAPWLCCFLLLLLFSPSPGLITRLECLVKELALKWPVNPCSIKIDSLYSLGSGQLLKVSLGDGADMQCVVVSGPMLEGGGWRGGKVRTLQRQAFLQGNLIFSGNSLPFLLTNRFQISCPFSWLLHELKSWWKEFIPPFLKPKCS